MNELDELRALRDRLAEAIRRAEASSDPLPFLSARERENRRRLIASIDDDVKRLETALRPGKGSR